MQCSQRSGETGEGEIKGMTEGAEEGHEEELCVCLCVSGGRPSGASSAVSGGCVWGGLTVAGRYALV